jgi:HK97 gp10 family phage protein
MPDVNVRVRKVYNHIPEVRAAIHSGCDELAESTAHYLASEAQTLAPVLKDPLRHQEAIPGFLKFSIHPVRIGMMRFRVVVEADYGVYVEYGTRNMPAQPYMRPAAEEAREFMQIQGAMMLRKACGR